MGADGYEKIKSHPYFKECSESNVYFSKIQYQEKVFSEEEIEIDLEIINEKKSVFIFQEYVRTFKYLFFSELCLMKIEKWGNIEIWDSKNNKKIISFNINLIKSFREIGQRSLEISIENCFFKYEV